MIAIPLFFATSFATTLTVGTRGEFAYIQDAVDVASNGDILIIAAGNYEECVDLGGKNLTLEGEGAESTILDGGGDCSAALTMELGETATVSGLTITNAEHPAVSMDEASASFMEVSITDSGNDEEDGGGIYMIGGTLSMVDSTFSGNTADRGGAIATGSYSQLILDSCRFEGNTSSSSGGAIYASQNVDILLSGSLLEGNSASDGEGGALYLWGEITLTDEGSAILSNTASSDGGAIYGYKNVTLNLEGSTLDSNESTRGNGGAIYVGLSGGTVLLTDVELSSNRSNAESGGAIYASLDTTLQLEDTFLHHNSASESGGAVYLYAANLVVLNSTFEQNSSDMEDGGAIFASEAMGTIYGIDVMDSDFEQNSAADDGGAIYAYRLLNVTLTGSTFERNGSRSGTVGGSVALKHNTYVTVSGNTFFAGMAGTGGAIYAQPSDDVESSQSYTNNIFSECEAVESGGAIYLYQGTPALLNNTFVGNSALESGGAVYLNFAGARLTNNIFAHTQSGDALHAADATSAESLVTFNDWYGNVAADSSGISGLSTSSDGNISSEPGFVLYSLDGDTSNDDLTLDTVSDLIDAGDPTIRDPDGSYSDIGAYGGPDSSIYDMDGDRTYNTTDCNDGDATIYPNATELCDELDNDCDGAVDEDVEEPTVWCVDEDGDGSGDPASCSAQCDAPGAEGWVENGADCDDNDASSHPGADETPGDGIDQDCDGADRARPDSAELDSAEMDSEDADPDVSVKGWACTGCASSSSPAGPLAVMFALLGLVGLRRRA